jgi:hypothetical protein
LSRDAAVLERELVAVFALDQRLVDALEVSLVGRREAGVERHA